MKILVFVGSHCPHCPAAVKVVKDVSGEYRKYGVTFEKIRTRTPEGKKLSGNYGISAVPTIIILDEKGNESKRITGAPKESSLKSDIEEILGIKKKSFFDRILGR